MKKDITAGEGCRGVVGGGREDRGSSRCDAGS